MKQGGVTDLKAIFADYLQGHVGLSELLDAIAQAKAGLVAHQNDVSNTLQEVPEFLIKIERDAWQKEFSQLSHLLAEAESRLQDRAVVEKLAKEYGELSDAVGLHAMLVRDAAWAARGPSTHGGMNELLYLAEGVAEGDETSEGLFFDKLEGNLERMAHQKEMLDRLPLFVQEALNELFQEYEGLARQLFEDAGNGLDWEEVSAALEEWALEYSQYDLDFLTNRYSSHPTPVPSVNFAMNSQQLFLSELVGEAMVDYAVEQALQTLESGSEQFLIKPELTDIDRHAYKEALAELSDSLEQLPETEEPEELKQLGSSIIQASAKLLQISQRAEGSGGSRLDYKTS